MLAEAKRLAAIKDPEAIKALPQRAQVYARRTLSLAAQGPTVDVILQAIKIGELAVCCIPFETLVEIGLELKAESPFPKTMVIGLANARYGYLPTPAQHRLGGYETWIGTNKVQKDASDIIIRNFVRDAGMSSRQTPVYEALKSCDLDAFGPASGSAPSTLK